MDVTPELKLKIACEVLRYKIMLHFEYQYFSQLRKNVMCKLLSRKLMKKYLLNDWS